MPLLSLRASVAAASTVKFWGRSPGAETAAEDGGVDEDVRMGGSSERAGWTMMAKRQQSVAAAVSRCRWWRWGHMELLRKWPKAERVSWKLLGFLACE